MLEDFYPTPRTLIEKMIDEIEFDKINSILEPSAGKGDICDFIAELKHAKYNNGYLKIDVIEIEKELQHILKDKKYNLVFDDFLNFKTYKKYDLIIANFPFSEGEKHLGKALEMINDGGNLVCLVNAETIKNPYTNLRKTINKKLESLNASVAYLKDEFINAERKTNVEVALIKVSCKEKQSTIILEELKKAEEFISDEELCKQIIDSNPINALIQRFNFESKIGIKIIEEYFCLKPLVLNSLDSDYKKPIINLEIINHSYSSNTKSETINRYLEELRTKFWTALIRNKNFINNFTSNLISELENKLQDLANYDFNKFNIEKLEYELSLKINENIEQTILKLFDEFSNQHSYNEEFGDNIHYYNGWKTNKSHFINKKIIIPFYCKNWSNEVDIYNVRAKMNDIIKVLNYLQKEIDDIPKLVDETMPESRNFVSYRKINLYYFTATLYKKGTCHIEFNNQKLLDKFNIFGCQKKGWLPPSYGKKKYNNMTEEEQQVVDNFQGKEKYNEIMNNKDEYLVEFNNRLLLT